MTISLRRSLLIAALVSLFSMPALAETIIKLDFGATGTVGPDIELEDGVLSTVDDNIAGTPGDQDTSVTFHGFVSGSEVDITPPNQGSYSLAGVSMVGSPFVVNQGLFSLVTQQTTGGTFELYDDAGEVLLTASLQDGSLHGTTGASATGGFLTANLGSFTGPAASELFGQLAPNTASLAISLTDVSSPNGAPGLSVSDEVLQNFSADATANIGADPIGVGLPEPTSISMALFGILGILGFRRRR